MTDINHTNIDINFFPSPYSMRFAPQRLTQSIDWHGHLNFAAWLLEITRPASLVELGVFRGDSLSAFSQAARELQLSCDIIGIDTWAGDETTGRYSEGVFADVKDYFDANFPTVRLIRSLFDEVLSTVPDGSVDILHIDGSHIYDDVKHDYITWLPKMSDRGIILFHDVSVGNASFGTKQFWDETRNDFPSFKFDHSNGLGVLLCGSRQPDVLLSICKNELLRDSVKAVFEQTGGKFFHRAKEKYWRGEAEKVSVLASQLSGDVGREIADSAIASFSSYFDSGSFFKRRVLALRRYFMTFR